MTSTIKIVKVTTIPLRNHGIRIRGRFFDHFLGITQKAGCQGAGNIWFMATYGLRFKINGS